jgi:hypothetical protein
LNNLLNLIAQLAPLATTFVPQAGEAAAIASLAAGLLAHIQQQTGKSTDEILADAGATLDDNEKKLLEDQARLRGATP